MILRTNSLTTQQRGTSTYCHQRHGITGRRQCVGAAATSSFDATSLSLRPASDLCLCLAGVDLPLNTCCSGLLDTLCALIRRFKGYLLWCCPKL